MARNQVQFQKGLSEQEFDRLYGIEELCRAVVVAARWPDGFECPACAGWKHSVIKSRGLFQCSACRRQTSPTAGTIFASTKLALRRWFRAMYPMTQSKKGISSIELGRRLGVKQDTAWKVKHKLKQVMLERDAAKKLSGRIEIDDAYVGGERRGGKRGRGAAGKTPFVAAVETTEDGKPVRLKLRRVAGFSGAAIEDFAERSLAPDCAVVSDGLACFASVTKAGCTHTVSPPERGGVGHLAAFRGPRDRLAGDQRLRLVGPAILVMQAGQRRPGQRVECLPATRAAVPRLAASLAPGTNVIPTAVRTAKARNPTPPDLRQQVFLRRGIVRLRDREQLSDRFLALPARPQGRS